MKRHLFLILFLTTTSFSFGQSVYPYEEVKLARPSDYKEAEPLALSAASFLLSTPFKEKDNDRSHAVQFLTKWMAGTKDYSFQITGTAQDISESHALFDLFTAALVKFSIENKTLLSYPNLVDAGSCKLVLAYCDNPVNNFKLKKKERKILEKN